MSCVRGLLLLPLGIISSGITSDMNASFALLSEHLGDSDPNMLIGAVLGLGISYAGTQNPDIYELLLQPLLHDSLEVASTAALALGLVYVGSGFPEAVNTILDVGGRFRFLRPASFCLIGCGRVAFNRR